MKDKDINNFGHLQNYLFNGQTVRIKEPACHHMYNALHNHYNF